MRHRLVPRQHIHSKQHLIHRMFQSRWLIPSRLLSGQQTGHDGPGPALTSLLAVTGRSPPVRRAARPATATAQCAAVLGWKHTRGRKNQCDAVVANFLYRATVAPRAFHPQALVTSHYHHAGRAVLRECKAVENDYEKTPSTSYGGFDFYISFTWRRRWRHVWAVKEL